MAEEDLQRAVAEYEVLRAELEALARQDELLSLSMEEHMRAKETMVRYQKGGKGAEILVPIGANSFLFAEVRDPDKALVGVGSDLTVEDTMENAIKRMERIMEELTAAAEGTAKKIAETSEKISEKSAIVRELYGRAQSQEG